MTKRKPSARKARAKKREPSSGRWPWVVAGVGVFALIVAIAISAAPESAPAVAERDPAAVAAGAELYQASCAQCHGADLEGTATGPSFLDVTYAPNHHGDEAFQRAAAAGVVPHHWNFGPMPPVVPALSREEVALIVEFVRSEQEAAGILRDPRHP